MVANETIIASPRIQLRRMVDVSSSVGFHCLSDEADPFSVGNTQKGDPVKELMQTAFDCGRSGENLTGLID